MIPERTFDEFERKVRYPIKDFLKRYVDFIFVHKRNVVDYYSGASKDPYMPSFIALEDIVKEGRLILDSINNVKGTLRNASLWELCDKIDDMYRALRTVDNASKWLRSAITKNNFNPDVEMSHTLRMLQTLEQMAENVVGSSNPQQGWVRIALRNDLREEDYTADGGVDLVFSRENGVTVQLQSVIDNIQGENIYGADILRKITFEDDDLKVLDYKDTLVQAVEILSTLKQGDNPSFPDHGVQSALTVGGNRGGISFPILIRQYYETFQRDDTLKSFAIRELDIDQDALFIEFEVTSRIDEVFTHKVSI